MLKSSVSMLNSDESPAKSETLEVKSSTLKPPHFLSHVKYEYLAAGMLGGITSTIILHPLDLIKIRFAVNDGHTAGTKHYHGIRNAFSTIAREEGWRGLYRGVTPNVWGAGASWGFYFLFYNTLKAQLQEGDAEKPLGPHLHLVAAAQSGVMTLAMTNPFWVVKTRLCLQHGDNSAVPPDKRYSGMSDALSKIYKQEGIKGLYKGFVPGIFGVSHGAIQFMAYEEMKNRLNVYQGLPINTKLAVVDYLVFAAASKLLAAALTYPYQVVRARLQDQLHAYNGSLDCIARTYRHEGIRGFYKGLSANLTRVVPATMLTFLVYEKSSHFLLSLRNSPKIPANE